jgi:hypothetical protein
MAADRDRRKFGLTSRVVRIAGIEAYPVGRVLLIDLAPSAAASASASASTSAAAAAAAAAGIKR